MSRLIIEDEDAGIVYAIRDGSRRTRIKERIAKRDRRRKSTTLGGTIHARKSFDDMFGGWIRKDHRRLAHE